MEGKSFSTAPIRGLQNLVHIGFIVKDLEKSMEYYSRLFSLKSWYRPKNFLVEYTYKGKEVKIKLEIANGYMSGLGVELMEAKSADENVYTRFLEEHGQGLHHTAWQVKDLEKQMEALKPTGLTPVQKAVFRFKDGTVATCAFLDTVSACGYYTELLEIKSRGMSVPQSRLTSELACLMGTQTKSKL